VFWLTNNGPRVGMRSPGKSLAKITAGPKNHLRRGIISGAVIQSHTELPGLSNRFTGVDPSIAPRRLRALIGGELFPEWKRHSDGRGFGS